MTNDADELRRQIEQGLLVQSHLERDEPVRVALAERMAYYRVPGVSIAVVAEGEIAWASGYGVREAGLPEGVTPETLFLAGSISKPVTALAVMRLVQEGRLELDEDVNAYLRSWRVPANGDWQPRLTLRQLLSHTAGLTVHGFPGYQRDEVLPSVPRILDGVAPANTAPVRVNLLPGAQFRYAGGGTTVVQLLLSDVLGQPFPELMRELVLEPLGMRASSYANPLPERYWGQAAAGHLSGGRPVAGRWHVYPEMAAAGLWTTASDLARCVLGVQRAVAGEAGALLTRETAAEMLTPLVETGFEPGHRIGIGFFLNGEDAARRFGHSGSDAGFTADLSGYVSGGWGAVAMTNGDAWAAIELLGEIFNTIADAYGWPEYRPVPRETLAAGPEVGEQYAGEYEVRPGYRLTLAVDADGALTLQVSGQAPLALRAVAEREFVVPALNAEVEIELGEDGRAFALVLRQGGRESRAGRLA